MFVDEFKRLCVVRADISKVSNVFVLGMFGPLAAKKIKVVLRCGAELQAQISWLENVSIFAAMFEGALLNMSRSS